MGYKLCMAEKPSVARDIASVIGADKKCKGYYEGNGYRVTWAVGHLVGLAEPEEYGFVSKEAMWRDEKEKAYAELPIIPDNFKLVVLEQTEEQFEIIKELIHRDDTDEIINCGDMGAEGHILQWFIREKAECTKKVRRFCATSMTEEAIRQAMSHLRPEEEFANIIKGEFCKKKADWIMGMSMSRVESLKYKTGINVGRVQSPTLYFVVKRYLEVKNFKVTNYYGIQADLKEGFSVFWNKDTEGIFPPNAKDSEGRVLDGKAVKAKAEAIQEKCSLSVFHAEKGNIDNVFKTRVDIGDGYQTSLVDHMKQISSASPILAGFEKATREQGAKEKIMFNSTHREEVVAEQTEKTGALSDRAMSREEWGNEIASAKQAEVNNSREDNEPQKNTRSKTEMEKG